MVTGDTGGLTAVPEAVEGTLAIDREIAGGGRAPGPHFEGGRPGPRIQPLDSLRVGPQAPGDGLRLRPTPFHRRFRPWSFRLAGDRIPVLAVLPEGAITDDSLAILERARDEGGATVSVISNVPLPGNGDGDLRSVRTPDVAEWVSPITFIVAAQLFTLHMALARGVDPERPRGLRKVTRTS